MLDNDDIITANASEIVEKISRYEKGYQNALCVVAYSQFVQPQQNSTTIETVKKDEGVLKLVQKSEQ